MGKQNAMFCRNCYHRYGWAVMACNGCHKTGLSMLGSLRDTVTGCFSYFVHKNTDTITTVTDRYRCTRNGIPHTVTGYTPLKGCNP